MSDETIDVILLPKPALQDGWELYTLKSVGGNIKRKSGTVERTVWATLEVPEGYEQRVAIPTLEEELGEQPEGTVTLAALERAAHSILERLEAAIVSAEEQTQEW